MRDASPARAARRGEALVSHRAAAAAAAAVALEQPAGRWRTQARRARRPTGADRLRAPGRGGGGGGGSGRWRGRGGERRRGQRQREPPPPLVRGVRGGGLRAGGGCAATLHPGRPCCSRAVPFRLPTCEPGCGPSAPSPARGGGAGGSAAGGGGAGDEGGAAVPSLAAAGRRAAALPRALGPAHASCARLALAELLLLALASPLLPPSAAHPAVLAARTARHPPLHGLHRRGAKGGADGGPAPHASHRSASPPPSTRSPPPRRHPAPPPPSMRRRPRRRGR